MLVAHGLCFRSSGTRHEALAMPLAALKLPLVLGPVRPEGDAMAVRQAFGVHAVEDTSIRRLHQASALRTGPPSGRLSHALSAHTQHGDAAAAATASFIAAVLRHWGPAMNSASVLGAVRIEQQMHAVWVRLIRNPRPFQLIPCMRHRALPMSLPFHPVALVLSVLVDCPTMTVALAGPKLSREKALSTQREVHDQSSLPVGACINTGRPCELTFSMALAVDKLTCVRLAFLRVLADAVELARLPFALVKGPLRVHKRPCSMVLVLRPLA
mmetsp:Transcript_60183/g.172876  ORF Transcript_60183/g.172876 Transcript_60183/m.172876 type:complete len:270 (-) Transcript_60183:12-821(-)